MVNEDALQLASGTKLSSGQRVTVAVGHLRRHRRAGRKCGLFAGKSLSRITISLLHRRLHKHAELHPQLDAELGQRDAERHGCEWTTSAQRAVFVGERVSLDVARLRDPIRAAPRFGAEERMYGRM